MKDLLGQKLGKWSVLRKVDRPKYLKGHDAYYECLCDCGSIRIVKAASLRQGNSTSCGCFTIPLLQDKKFGQLTIIGLGNLKDHVIFYLCKCECGIEKQIRYHDLIRADGKGTLSCGHDKIHSVPEEARLSTARMVYRDSYNDGDLSFDKFLELSQLSCHYCGIHPNNLANVFKKKLGSSDFAIENGTFIYSGLDRLDNNSLHNISNLVPCCIKCNWAKNKMGYQEFLIWIAAVYKHRIEK